MSLDLGPDHVLFEVHVAGTPGAPKAEDLKSCRTEGGFFLAAPTVLACASPCIVIDGISGLFGMIDFVSPEFAVAREDGLTLLARTEAMN